MSSPSATPVSGSPRGASIWVLVLLALALIAVGVLTVRSASRSAALRRALPQRDGAVALAGLEQPVTVLRDAWGTPHIRAASESDAWRALGFVHAQDRLAQMEWLRRSARGRVAEVLGSEALPADRLARTLGIGRHAEAQVARLDRATRTILAAYSQGVNARIARIRSGQVGAPRPLARLDVPLEPWTPADSLAVVKLVAWSLDGSVDASLVLERLIERLGGFGARPFFPPAAAEELVPLPLRHRARSTPNRELSQLSEFRGDWALLRHALGLAGRNVGSSAWLVAPSLTRGGAPLLAGDLHLEPSAPVLFHHVTWRAGATELAGATIPGAPVFWSGHNGRVAWTATHARAAVVDLYEETLDLDAPARSLMSGRWQPIVERSETIAVRDAEDDQLLVRETGHGPLLDGLLREDRPRLALAWPGAQPGDGVSGLLRAARAQDAESFRQALSAHHEPVLAFLYADVDGRGGLQVAGWVPRRPLASGLVPVPGRAGWYDWRGRLALDELPHAPLDDSTPWLIAADNALVEPPDGPIVEWWWRTGDRAQRIEALLLARSDAGPLDIEELVAMQRDTHADAARARVARLLELAGDPERLRVEGSTMSELLAGWDGDSSRNSRGAAAWHVLLDEVLHGVLDEPLGPGLVASYLELRGVSPENLLDRLLDTALGRPPDPDAVVDAASLRRAARAGLERTGLRLRAELGTDSDRWRWGRLHRLRFGPFGWTARAWSPEPAPGEFAYGGDGSTIAVAEYGPDAYGVRVVAAQRIAIDLADPQMALAGLAPGPSEHPTDPLARAGLERWLEGRPVLLTTHPLVVEESARARLVLEPAP